MKKVIKILIVLVVVAALGFLVWWVIDQNTGKDETSANEASLQTKKSTAQSDKTLTEVIAANKSLSTINSALTTASLIDSIQGVGPYTVLAPNDAAFKALPAGTLETLLKADKREQLTDIIKYHILPGDVKVDQLTNGQKVQTVEGGELVVEKTDQKVYFIDAKGGKALVETADFDAKNGTVHIINAVLLPQ